jgi:hypothetical protein
MGKSRNDKVRNGIAYGMMLSGKTTKVMRDRRKRRSKDMRNHFSNQEW